MITIGNKFTFTGEVLDYDGWISETIIVHAADKTQALATLATWDDIRNPKFLKVG